jgi:CDP-6-deoxy-D-xylo-4-hexulose-3-dehydrase
MKNRIYKKHPDCNEVANDVMENGILLGCHQGMNKADLNYICKTFEKIISKTKR